MLSIGVRNFRLSQHFFDPLEQALEDAVHLIMELFDLVRGAEGHKGVTAQDIKTARSILRYMATYEDEITPAEWYDRVFESSDDGS